MLAARYNQEKQKFLSDISYLSDSPWMAAIFQGIDTINVE